MYPRVYWCVIDCSCYVQHAYVTPALQRGGVAPHHVMLSPRSGNLLVCAHTPSCADAVATARRFHAPGASTLHGMTQGVGFWRKYCLNTIDKNRYFTV